MSYSDRSTKGGADISDSRLLLVLVPLGAALFAPVAPAGAQYTGTQHVAVRKGCTGDVQAGKIVAINTQTGIVTVNSEPGPIGLLKGGTAPITFGFGASNPAVLSGLHVDQEVCADFRDEKVTVDKQVASADTRFWVVDGVKVFAITWPGVSRGVITAISTPQGGQSRPALTTVVTAVAREGPTPRTLEFKVPTKLLRQLHIGQTVWADFHGRKVSLVEPSGGTQVGAIDEVQVFAITAVR